MGETFTFFSDVWATFLKKDAVDQIAIAATILFPLMIPIIGWFLGIRTWRTRKRLLEQENE